MSDKGQPELHFADRHAWRAWLKKNHDRAGVLWMVFYKGRPDLPTVPYDDAVEEALCFGWIDSTIRKIDEERYVRKFTPRRSGSRWSDLNRERAEKMIRAKRMTKTGMEKIRMAKDEGTWETGPAPTKAPPMPDAFREALDANATARKHFDTLAPSYRRQYLGWIAAAKREETQRKRIAEAIGLLEKNEKLGMK